MTKSDTNWVQMSSKLDQSVNFYHATPDGGNVECRYVRRRDDKLIVYISSHTGCNKSCRMCHLTATGQTMMQESSLDSILGQARIVLDYAYKSNLIRNTQKVNFNFMARGEPLASSVVRNALSNNLFKQLSKEVQLRHSDLDVDYKPRSQFNVSSIMPQEMTDIHLMDVLGEQANLYYSLYSLNPSFRKRWLPKSLDPTITFQKIADWQRELDYLDKHIYDGAKLPKVVLHWAFIDGENDSLEDVNQMLDAVKDYNLKVYFNLVRFNPPDNSVYKETSEDKLNALFDVIKTSIPKSQIIPRVGFDVKASCGTFIA